MPNNGHNETISGGGFHHVAIRAYDFDASMKFYMEGLGFKRKYGWGEDDRAKGGKDSRGALLDTGDGNYLELFGGSARKPGDNPADLVMFHFALRTTDVDAALERARAAGGVVTVEPKDVVPPNPDEPAQTFRIAFVNGPDGESVEFFYNSTL